MRSILLPCIVLLVSCLSSVTALAGRGAAERILYYYAYLAEEVHHQLAPGYAYTVAPGCEKEAGHRCSLSEFLRYIWTPGAGQTEADRPTEGIRGTANTVEVNMRSIDYLWNEIYRFEDPKTGAIFTGNSDSSRLLPGSENFYDALSKMGRPVKAADVAIQVAAASNPHNKNLKQWSKIIARGKQSAQLVVSQRWKDMERYRIGLGGLRTHLGFDPETKFANDGLKGHPPYKTLDATATVNKRIDEFRDIRDRLRVANEAYQRPRHIADHFRAISAAESALVGCDCDIPTTGGL